MNALLTHLTQSSVGRKFIMAITGLGAIGFLVGHLAGNLLIFLGPAAFNEYAAMLHAKPVLLMGAEAGLLVLFTVHMVCGIILTAQNMRARPATYDVEAYSGKSTAASRTMIVTGVIALVFMLMHVFTIKLLFMYRGEYHSLSTFERTLLVFEQPFVAFTYIVGVIAVGMHVFHGAQSTLQSLGIRHPNFECLIIKGGRILAIALIIGFASLPAWVCLKHDSLTKDLAAWKARQAQAAPLSLQPKTGAHHAP